MYMFPWIYWCIIIALAENVYWIASLNHYYSSYKIEYIVRNIPETPVQSPLLLHRDAFDMWVQQGKDSRFLFFCSMSLGEVITLHQDLTAATTVGYYTFISHGSITLHVYGIDVHIWGCTS